jgi:hypothetical protein
VCDHHPRSPLTPLPLSSLRRLEACEVVDQVHQVRLDGVEEWYGRCPLLAANPPPPPLPSFLGTVSGTITAKETKTRTGSAWRIHRAAEERRALASLLTVRFERLPPSISAQVPRGGQRDDRLSPPPSLSSLTAMTEERWRQQNLLINNKSHLSLGSCLRRSRQDGTEASHEIVHLGPAQRRDRLY